jgi:murein DD-endopeptidase MepM/ murein hydrolase activator NlpD
MPIRNPNAANREKQKYPGTEPLESSGRGDGVFSGKQHSKYDPQDRGLSRVQKVLQRFFPEKQLIVRSGERMRTLRLSTNRQAFLVTVGIAVGTWTLFSSGLAMNHSERIRAKNIEIKDARVGYEQLLAQVSIYKQRVAELTGDLEKNYSHSLALVEKESDLLKEKAAELNQQGSKKTSLVSKITLRAKEAFADPQAALTGDSGNVELALSKAKLDRGHADDERKNLLAELADLEDSMVDVVGHHQKTPFIATDSLELRQVVLQRDLALSERENLTQRVASLENQIRDMESNDLLLYHRFSEVTERKIADIEGSLAITGLDIDLLVKHQKGTFSGEGGPFIPLTKAEEESGPLQESLNLLNANVDRLQDLQHLIGKLPLDAPLHQFELNSGFGVRKDPITGALSQHLGLDMGAAYKSTVTSPGAGRVIRAGFDGAYGRMVEIDHGMGLVTRYAHLARTMVKEGDRVERGTEVGQVGCSGRCTGSHLHYEVIYNGQHVNPLKFLKAGSDVFKG